MKIEHYHLRGHREYSIIFPHWKLYLLNKFIWLKPARYTISPILIFHTIMWPIIIYHFTNEFNTFATVVNYRNWHAFLSHNFCVHHIGDNYSQLELIYENNCQFEKVRVFLSTHIRGRHSSGAKRPIKPTSTHTDDDDGRKWIFELFNAWEKRRTLFNIVKDFTFVLRHRANRLRI